MKIKLGELKKVVHDVIAEDAVKPSQAEQKGLALLRVNDGDEGHTYVLYDPAHAYDLFKNAATGKGKSEISPQLIASEDFIVAMINCTKPEHPSNDASEIHLAAAKKGYGPMMYDIVMGMEGGLISDRHAVSKFARGVWAKYKNRNDVKASLLDDYEDPKTKDPNDDATVFDGGKENPLNYSYTIARTPKASELMSKHEDLIDAIEKFGYDRGQIETVLAVTATDYFRSKYASQVVATNSF